MGETEDILCVCLFLCILVFVLFRATSLTDARQSASDSCTIKSSRNRSYASDCPDPSESMVDLQYTPLSEAD